MVIDFARNDYGQAEMQAVQRVLESSWLASGKENEAFEEEFAEYVGAQHAVCVNSGSSANLLALASLQLPKGTRILTAACGFPATLNPCLHLGFTPVFVDYDVTTHNIDTQQILCRLPDVRAVILAHTMGNPVDLSVIKNRSRELGVCIVEDCCEAAGTWVGEQSVGTIGDVGTFSFYPSHQITAGGGGGMIVTNNREVALRCKELRDWGKCWDWDETLGDNKTKYDKVLEGVSFGYFRHYSYAQVGHNMKLPEMCAAFGREQLKRLDEFSQKRFQNFHYLRDALKDLECFLPVQEHPVSSPSWFGYVFTLRDGCNFTRNQFGDYLERMGIRHRPFFAGNVLRHRPFRHLDEAQRFPIADKLMSDSLFIGCHSKMTKADLDYVISTVRSFAG